MLAQMDNDPKMATKPEQVKEKIVMGKLNKFYEENCLLQQAFVKDGDQYMNNAAKAGREGGGGGTGRQGQASTPPFASRRARASRRSRRTFAAAAD